MRAALIRNHDASKPVPPTELSWPSAKGQSRQHFDWNTTEAGQARAIATLLPALAAQRKALGLIGFYYYMWIGDEYKNAPAFNFAGLIKFRRRDGRIVPKPALSAFTRAALGARGWVTKRLLATAGATKAH